MFTSQLEEADVKTINNKDSICPSAIQPKLDKEMDLRVTVVGEKVFATAILSQFNKETEVDWRTWGTIADVELPHERFKLPSSIESKCLQINDRLNLRFSCIDLVLTKSNEFYFLELNPNGQWAWIEELNLYPISNTIIDTLLGSSH